MTRGSRQLVCLLLSPMVAALTLLPWLPATTPEGAGPADPSVVRVRLVHSPAASVMPAIDPAQPRRSNSAGDKDQTGRRPRQRQVAMPDGYLPLSRLTEWPVALNDLAPDFDDSTRDGGVQLLEAVLLINEFGGVDRVLLSDAGWAQQALLDHLRRLRFAPGRLFGRPVKSALRIELRLH